MNSLQKIFRGDRAIWLIFLFLCIISLIEVFSASSRLTYQTGNYLKPLSQHFAFLLCGLVEVLFIVRMDYKWFKLFPLFLLPLSFVLLIVTLFAGHGINGASRWINILGIQFQPSEIAKMGMIIYTASILRKQDYLGARPNAFKLIVIPLLLFCMLIFPENFSTTALLFLVIVLMMIIGRVSLQKIGILVGSLMGLVILVLSITWLALEGQAKSLEEEKPNVEKKASAEDHSFLHRATVWVARLDGFVNEPKDVPAEKYDISKNEQVGHARIAVATSSLLGKAPGNSVQRDFLSEAASDFIFAIIIEEMGLVGGIVVVFLYIWLLIRAGRIAKRCDKTFPALLIMGIALMIVSQAMVNMMVAVGLFPVTGQPLPLISKGGTSTLINCAYIGMMLSVSQYVKGLSNKSKKNQELLAETTQPIEPTSELLNEDTKMK